MGGLFDVALPHALCNVVADPPLVGTCAGAVLGVVDACAAAGRSHCVATVDVDFLDGAGAGVGGAEPAG